MSTARPPQEKKIRIKPNSLVPFGVTEVLPPKQNLGAEKTPLLFLYLRHNCKIKDEKRPAKHRWYKDFKK